MKHRTDLWPAHIARIGSRGAGKSRTRPVILEPGRGERIPATGTLLAIWNGCCVDPENGLMGPRLTRPAALGEDGGRRWNLKRDVERAVPGMSVKYPATNIRDGGLYVSYRVWARPPGQPYRMQGYLPVLPSGWFHVERDQPKPAPLAGSGRN